jgi:hypothetical protein
MKLATRNSDAAMEMVVQVVNENYEIIFGVK